MRKVYVEILGCDDHTNFPIDISVEDIEIIEMLARKSMETSTYGCMPVINYYIVEEEDLEKHLRWKKLEDNSDRTEEEERELFSNYYDEYWLEDQAVKEFTRKEFNEEKKKKLLKNF